MKRPALHTSLDSKTLKEYYYLKEELVDFCRKNGLPTSGGKIEITERIAYFLDTGKVSYLAKAKKKAKAISCICEETLIEPDFVCSQVHREFFKEKIGQSFSFPVAFQTWLKENTGKTYQEAISAYYQILADKKKGKTIIDKQFEYNTYIRAFFDDNKGRTLKEAIQCWKYKKQMPGHNRYETSDLKVLDVEVL